MFTAFLASTPMPVLMVSSVTPMRWSFHWGGEKGREKGKDGNGDAPSIDKPRN